MSAFAANDSPREKLKQKDLADYFGVSARTVRRWVKAGFLRLVKRRTARGHVSTQILKPTLEQLTSLKKGHPVKKAWLRKLKSNSPGPDYGELFRIMDTYAPGFLAEVLLGATPWEKAGRNLKELAPFRAASLPALSPTMPSRDNCLFFYGDGEMEYYDRNDLVTIFFSGPEKFLANIAAELPNEELSKLSKLKRDALIKLQSAVLNCNARQRNILMAILRLQQENPGQPPSDRDVWKALEGYRVGSRLTFWRDMKNGVLKGFLERLYGSREKKDSGTRAPRAESKSGRRVPLPQKDA